MFKYTGLHIKQCSSEIQVDQRGYVENIKPIASGKRRSTQKYDDFNQDEREEFQTIFGQLNWVSTNTRPETLYETGILSNAMKTCKVKDILARNNPFYPRFLNPIKPGLFEICQTRGNLPTPHNSTTWRLITIKFGSVTLHYKYCPTT